MKRGHRALTATYRYKNIQTQSNAYNNRHFELITADEYTHHVIPKLNNPPIT